MILTHRSFDANGRTSQIRNVLSMEFERTYDPSGDRDREVTVSVCPVISWAGFVPFLKSQILTTLSIPELMICSLESPNATDVTWYVEFKFVTGFFLLWSHTLTEQSSEALAIKGVPSPGPGETAFTKPVWPLNRFIRWHELISNKPTVLSVDAVTNWVPLSLVNCKSTMAPPWDGENTWKFSHSRRLSKDLKGEVIMQLFEIGLLKPYKSVCRNRQRPKTVLRGEIWLCIFRLRDL